MKKLIFVLFIIVGCIIELLSPVWIFYAGRGTIRFIKDQRNLRVYTIKNRRNALIEANGDYIVFLEKPEYCDPAITNRVTSGFNLISEEDQKILQAAVLEYDKEIEKGIHFMDSVWRRHYKAYQYRSNVIKYLSKERNMRALEEDIQQLEYYYQNAHAFRMTFNNLYDGKEITFTDYSFTQYYKRSLQNYIDVLKGLREYYLNRNDKAGMQHCYSSYYAEQCYTGQLLYQMEQRRKFILETNKLPYTV